MPHRVDYSVAAAVKRNSQSAYAMNLSVLDAERARGCSYGQIRRARNSLVRMTSS